MDASNLQALLEAHPDEPALYAMLVDCLQEEGSYSPESATLISDQTVRLGRSARDLARATHLMRTDSEGCEYLRSIIRRCLDRVPPPGTMVVVVPGHGVPMYTDPAGPRGLTARRRAAIQVGAEWVCQQWDARLAELERRRQRDALIPRPQ